MKELLNKTNPLKFFIEQSKVKDIIDEFQFILFSDVVFYKSKVYLQILYESITYKYLS